MELVTGDLKVIEEECNLLRNHLFRTKNQSDVIATISSLDILSELYFDVTGVKNEHIERYKRSKSFCQKASNKQNIQANQFIENFIKNKEFHNLVMNDVLYQMGEKIDDLTSIENNTILSHKEMYEIMKEYLSKKNMDGYLDDVIVGKRIFYGYSSNFYAGYMAFNVVHDVPHILIDKDMNSIEIMTAIVHEVGHIRDYFDLSLISDLKTVNDYYMKSIYSEVISKKNEKEFLDFLIKNRIASKDVCCMVEDYYLDIKSHLEDLLILTSLDDRFLRREKYRNLSIDEIISEIVGKDTIEGINENLFNPRDLDLFRSLSYGYGGVLAIYFDCLRKQDQEKYEYSYQNFLSKRAGWFQIGDFITFVEDYQELPNIIGRKMDKDIRVKQKIYHEN